MNREHNDVNIELEKYYSCWESRVNDQFLVRWLIDPQKIKFVHTLIKREACEEGKWNELFILLSSPFVERNRFEHTLISEWKQQVKDWIQTIHDDQDQTYYRNCLNAWKEAINSKEDKISLREGVYLFKEYFALQDNTIAIHITPRSINSTKDFENWIGDQLKNSWLKNHRLVVIDHLTSPFLTKVAHTYSEKTVTLSIPKEQGSSAISQSNKEEKNSYESKFRSALEKMNTAFTNQDLQNVNYWGKKAIGYAQESGLPYFSGVAYASYIAVLLNFSNQEHTAENILNKALNQIHHEEFIESNPNMVQIIYQLLGMKVAIDSRLNQLNKAMLHSMEQAEFAMGKQLHIQAMETYRLSTLYGSSSDLSIKKECIIKAWQAALFLSEEEQIGSGFRFVALDFYNLNYNGLSHKETPEYCNELMTSIFSKNRIEEVESQDKIKKFGEPTPIQNSK